MFMTVPHGCKRAAADPDITSHTHTHTHRMGELEGTLHDGFTMRPDVI